MAYTRAAVERVMKVQEAILRALSGRQSWLQVADVLGVSPRTVRRLRWRYERYGYDGLVDHRRRCPSPRAVPAGRAVQQLLQLYRERYGPRDGHPGYNIRHFYQVAGRDHGVRLSYSFVKRALQTAGLVGQAAPARAASAPPRAAPVLWGTAAPRWQSAPVAGVGRRRPADPHRRGGRRDQAVALRSARGRGREFGGHHDGPAGGARGSTASPGRCTPIAPAGPSTRRRRAAPPIAPSGPRSGRALARLGIEHIVSLLAAGPGAERARQRHAARAARQRAAGRRDPDPRSGESLSARAVHSGLQRALCPRPGRSQQCLRARGAAAGPRPDPLPRGRALRRRGTTPSSSTAWCCRSTNSGAGAAARACASSCGGISTGGIRSGGGPAAWGGLRATGRPVRARAA